MCADRGDYLQSGLPNGVWIYRGNYFMHRFVWRTITQNVSGNGGVSSRSKNLGGHHSAGLSHWIGGLSKNQNVPNYLAPVDWWL